MLKTIRAFLHHPAVESMLITLTVASAVGQLQGLVERRQEQLATLDEQVRALNAERARLLDLIPSLQPDPELNAALVAEGATYPAAEDLDPLGNGQPEEK